MDLARPLLPRTLILIYLPAEVIGCYDFLPSQNLLILSSSFRVYPVSTSLFDSLSGTVRLEDRLSCRGILITAPILA
jgi:hypothetical protein